MKAMNAVRKFGSKFGSAPRNVVLLGMGALGSHAATAADLIDVTAAKADIASGKAQAGDMGSTIIGIVVVLAIVGTIIALLRKSG
ncbi:TPA: major capsid protein [Pseudomonas aeruginosa]|uniref:major capsid protein n=1 Tax=Pseudomonas aeruginosa TaxID=287 RepID=UPI0003B9E2D4|nr:major capsid protein [Pseudomonas aeruginosa]ELP1306620.1 major capsid protein [Pseudomonas aeruginosa]ERV04484.1 hypothetical protein Q084_00006 [Pseudomonas aeruginosa M9A.1]KSC76606.2 hypothetical protein AO888_05820 [Pseudomonas aeruginosa]MBI7196028.1 major capsid protein [Pseudomonas aeruginosa]MBI8564556.1 major capsid protein [Pseudomonas aeruginosa]